MIGEDIELWFGKYKGKRLSDVPNDYLQWIVESFDPEPLPGEKRGLTADQVRFMREQRKDLISAAEDELIEREDQMSWQVGDRAKLVGLSNFPALNGTHVTLMERHPRGWRLDIFHPLSQSGDRAWAYERHLKPIDDGSEKAAWKDCVWRPKELVTVEP